MKEVPATGSGSRPRRRRWLAVAVVGALAAGSGCGKKKIIASFPDSYAGVGLELRVEGDAPIVVRTIAGGSGEQAGILAGDRLLAIDGVGTKGKSLGDVVAKLRGSPDSQVTLTLDRKGERLIVALKRAKMVKQAADYAKSP